MRQKTKRIIVAQPILGGKARTFSSLKSCCEELGLKYETVRVYLNEGKNKEYRGESWAIYFDEHVVAVRNPYGGMKR